MLRFVRFRRSGPFARPLESGDSRIVNRPEWLLERRAAVEATYDAEAPSYDEHPYPVETQRRFVERLVATCPPGR